MADQNCIFCKIINKESPAKHIVETETVLVIEDIAPKAPIHYLIIPKKHVPTVADLNKKEFSLVADVAAMAKQLAGNLSGSQSFRLVANNGADAGQCVFHLHFHFLSGKKMIDL